MIHARLPSDDYNITTVLGLFGRAGLNNACVVLPIPRLVNFESIEPSITFLVQISGKIFNKGFCLVPIYTRQRRDVDDWFKILPNFKNSDLLANHHDIRYSVPTRLEKRIRMWGTPMIRGTGFFGRYSTGNCLPITDGKICLALLWCKGHFL
jgi:hypothetical protein